MSIFFSMREFFWCFSIDSRSLKLFRCALGGIALVDSILRISELSSHYAATGMLPASVAWEAIGTEPHGYLRWSFMFLNDADFWQFSVLAAYFLASGLLLLHRFVRPMTVALWIIHISVVNRAPTLINGGDTLLKLLLFWNMLIALQEWCEGPERRQRSIFGLATIGLLLQCCFLYWFTAILKNHSVWRSELTAVQYTLELGSIRTSAGGLLAQYPALTRCATFGTLLLEEIGPFLALAPRRLWPVRVVTVAIFLAFHLLLLAPTLKIGLFPYVCAAGWIPFVPGEFWDWLHSRRPDSALCPSPAESPTSRRGNRSIGVVGVNILAGTAIFYIVAWNLLSLYPVSTARWFTPSIRSASVALGLRQRWNLFASRPTTRDGWMLAVAKLESGKTVDLLTGQPPRWSESVGDIGKHYKNWRWRKHISSLVRKERRLLAENFHAYLIRSWNQTHDDKVRNMSLVFLYRDSDRPADGILQSSIYPVWKPADSITEEARKRPEVPEPDEEL